MSENSALPWYFTSVILQQYLEAVFREWYRFVQSTLLVTKKEAIQIMFKCAKQICVAVTRSSPPPPPLRKIFIYKKIHEHYTDIRYVLAALRTQ